MMRILVAHPGPQFSVHDVYVGWVEALRQLGAQLVEFNLQDRLTFYNMTLLETGPGQLRKALTRAQATELAVNGLYAMLYKTRPDVLLAVSGFFMTPDLMDLARKSGTHVVLLHTESPYEDDRQLQLAPHADLNLLNDPVNIDRFAAVAPTRYVPHAYRPAMHKPGPADPALASDLAFVGTGYASRIAFLEAMDLDGTDVLLAGNWQQLNPSSMLVKYVAHDIEECIDNEQAVQIYRSAKVGLNLYRREGTAGDGAAGMAMGPREVEMAACGFFFLREPRAENEAVLPMLPAVISPEEASDQLRYWLAHDSEREKLAAQAREAVAGRTFRNHAAALLRLVEE